MSKETVRGRTGLQNAGNTCFMNAALQCLLHAPELVLPFLDTSENPIEGLTNDKYKLVREFAKLARNHYSTSCKVQTTQGMRKAIKNIASYLCDGDQHDSHELMNFVLQGLEEELNRKNPERDKMDSNVRPEYYEGSETDMDSIWSDVYEASKEWWDNYMYHNDCFISDVLYGEICNEIQCVNCKKSVFNLSAFNTLYVPIQKNTVSLKVNLVLEGYSPETDEISVNYFTIQLSLKASDSIKMLDMRLHERFKAIMHGSEEAGGNSNDFIKDSKFVYILRKSTSKSCHYSRILFSTCVSEFANAKGSSIFAFFIPPTSAGSVPVFLQAGLLDKTQCLRVDLPDELDSYTMKLTSDPVPLLLSIPKQATALQLQDQIARILRISREHRINTNVNDPGSIARYSDPFSTIYIDAQYYTHSVFFQEGEIAAGVAENVAEGVAEKVVEGVTEKTTEGVAEKAVEGVTEKTTEGVTENVAEGVTEKTMEGVTEKTTEEAEAKAANSLQFPRFYCLPLSFLSQQTLKPSLLPELSASPSTSVFHLFAATDAKSDYRCVYLATRARGLPVASAFCFDRCEDANAVLNSLAAAVRVAPTPISYTDEQAEQAEELKSRGRKGAALEKPKQLQLADCLELKKPATVMLTGSGTCQYCHKSSAVLTTPYLCRLPALLLIQLKRFKYSAVSRKQAFGKEKICTYVEYPVHDFDLAEYLAPSARASLTHPDQGKYELQCVVNHTGGADFGHYFAYCRDGYNDLDNWFEYNDASVSAVREEEVVTKNAYLLLYRRKDLGNAVYSRISGMTILGGKKEEVSLESVKEKMMKVESERKLERERKDGVEKEKKEGVEEKEEKKGKRHLSKEEMKLKKAEQRAERKAERKRR